MGVASGYLDHTMSMSSAVTFIAKFLRMGIKNVDLLVLGNEESPTSEKVPFHPAVNVTWKDKPYG